MPLNMVDIDVEYTIRKVCGGESQRHHLETLGFLAGNPVRLLSKFNGYYVTVVKGSRIGIGENFAKMIVVDMND